MDSDGSDFLIWQRNFNTDAAIGGVTVASGDVNEATDTFGKTITFTATIQPSGDGDVLVGEVDTDGAIAGIIIAATSDNNRVATNGDGDVLFGEVDTDGAVAGIIIAATSDNNRVATNGDFLLI